MAAQDRPRVRWTAQNTQYTYNLGRRIYDVKTYPVRSPQGATILIYAHDNGLTLVWRGGRRLKPLQHDRSRERRNGAGKIADDAVMIIDSDDDEPAQAVAAPPFVDKPEFGDDTAEGNADYPEVTQTLDLALGAAVLHLAVLPMAPCSAEDAAWSGAEMLTEKMVIALSCATHAAYVVTLPLTPPSHESKARESLRRDLLAGNAGNGNWGETLIQLAGQNMPSDGIAMTLVKPKSSQRGKSVDRSEAPPPAPSTRVVVVAHTREARGSLRLWDVAVVPKRGDSLEKTVHPFQTEYLPSFVTGISFNPTHTTQLLVITSPHAVRLYDYAIPSQPADDTSDGPFPTQGSWLLSLYPPFARSASPSSTSRKPVVAAAWVSNGRAVLALLADGQWGIWDIEGSSPSTAGGAASTDGLGKTGGGLRGTALTAFSVTGSLDGTSSLRTAPSQRTSGAAADFVPMTPHTRRDVMATALAGGPERLATVHGGIEVVRLPPLQGSGTVADADECAVLWLGGASTIVAVIPGVARFWDTQLRRGGGGGVNLFSGAQPTRMIRLNDLSVGLAGERCCGIGAISKLTLRRRRRSAGREGDLSGGEDDDRIARSLPPGGLPIEVIVRGETRLTVVREQEVQDDTVKTHLLGARKKRVGERPSLAEPADAIIVYPRPDKHNRTTIGLSVAAPSRPSDVKAAFEPGRATRELFPPSSQRTGQPTAARIPTKTAIPARVRDAGLVFADSLDRAADAEGSEEDVDERAVEEELLDVMEIDQMLEEMEEERGTGRKHVFFEEGDGL